MFFTEEHGEIVEYVKVLSQQKDAQKSKYMENLKLVEPTVQVEKSHDIKQHGDTLVNINLEFESFEASCDILRKIGKASSSRKISYVPTNFIGTHSIGRDHKLEFSFRGICSQQT